jgi:hypothetical protein
VSTKAIPLDVGDWFEGILLETCRDANPSITRPRVRPVDGLPPQLRVEFPRSTSGRGLAGFFIVERPIPSQRRLSRLPKQTPTRWSRISGPNHGSCLFR